MALSNRSVIAGVQAKFFRKGAAFTLPSAGTASETSLPGSGDTAWVSFGAVSVGSLTPSQEEVKIFAPNPGRKRLKKVLTTKDELTIKFTSQEIGRNEFQALFKSAPVANAATTLTPFAGDPMEGWLSFTAKDTDDDLIFDITVYVHLRISGDVALGDDAATFEFEALVLDNALNVGNL